MVGSRGGGGVGEVPLELPGEEGFMVTGVKEGGEGWADSVAMLGEREWKQLKFAPAMGPSSPGNGRPK